MSEIRIAFRRPHPAQKEILTSTRRFNHLRCGRRFGKTSLIEELCKPAIEGHPVGIWFPTYPDLSEVWKEVKARYKPLTIKVSEVLKQIELITGGRIDFWSLDSMTAGSGRKYKRAIIDETANAKKFFLEQEECAWTNTIRPTLTDLEGDAFILSRPKGKNNGFYLLAERHKQFDNWKFFHFTSYDNPFLSRAELAEAKSQYDDLNFKQEYLAEYVDANDRAYLYAFDEKKHVILSYQVNPHLNLLVSFDFNVDPMTATISQKPNVATLRMFDEIRIESGSTPEVCDWILAKYNDWAGRITVTGDATGRNRTSVVKGNISHYDVITQKLALKKMDLIVPRQNSSHENSRILCNSVLQNADIKVTSNCTGTIRDCAFANVDQFGELIKTQAEGRHFFDNFRYTVEGAYPEFIKKPHLYK